MPLNFLLQTFIQSFGPWFLWCLHSSHDIDTICVPNAFWYTFPWCRLHNYDVQALFTLNRIALTPAGKLYRTGLLFKHILTVFPDLFRSEAAPLRSWTCVDTFRIGVCAALRFSVNKCSLADKSYTAKHWAGPYFLSRWRTLEQTNEISWARVRMGTSVMLAHFALWKIHFEYRAWKKSLAVLQSERRLALFKQRSYLWIVHLLCSCGLIWKCLEW